MTDNFQSLGNGTGPNPDRQEGPHANQILTDLDGNHVFGVDLGADKVNVWNLNPGFRKLIPNTVPFVPIASGSGPRHMAFHPDRRHAYLVSELASAVAVFDYDPVRAAFIWKQTISTLPPDLYNTNRGHNSVTIFEIEPGNRPTRSDRLGIYARGVAPRDEHRSVGNLSLRRQSEH